MSEVTKPSIEEMIQEKIALEIQITELETQKNDLAGKIRKEMRILLKAKAKEKEE